MTPSGGKKWPAVFGNRLDEIPPACFVCRHPEFEGREANVAVSDMCNLHRAYGAIQTKLAALGQPTTPTKCGAPASGNTAASGAA